MEQNYQVKSVEKALCLLQCFNSDRKEIGLMEFVHLTGYHKSSVFRLLANLRASGFVQVTNEGKYTVGSEIRRLGYLWDASESLKRKARVILEYLHDLTGETVFLVEYGFGRGICTDRIEANKALKITSQIGTTVPLFKGATGKSITAFLNSRERILAQTVQKDIETHSSNLTELEDEFKRIRKQGWALTTGEVDEGVTAFAVPLINEKGTVLGSISIAGPGFRFTEAVVSRYIDTVMKSVSDILW